MFSVLKQPVVCQLLSEDENQRLLASLGVKCVATCAAVVCVYVPDGSVSWRQIHCGVATIEKDSFRKSYFVRVYDIVKFSQLHEEAMFLEMGYTALTPNFHTFQGERSPMGLAFADVKEAKNFQNCFGSLVNRWTRKMNTGTQNHNITDINPLQPPKPATERPIVCRLLSEEDKQRLCACLDGKSVVDCAAVVCVHVPAGTDIWRQLHSGVATIEEDSSQKSCFIRVYDLKKSSKLHEEAIFLEMQYTTEASTFQQKFSDLLAKFSRKPATVTNSSGMVKSDSQPEINPMHVLELPVPEPAKSGFNLPGFRKKQKKAITISAPTNFRHVQHMGFNKDSQQFDMSVLDEKMLQEFLKDNNLHCLFNTAEDTEFAAQFIAKNIGIKKADMCSRRLIVRPMYPAPQE
ncbi:unnamed protein product [Dibothriocephalus latus]|uniref:CRIB domain-containing protein n=1 Tax=Dibothriocephalus latus TaxID=60516 RepID=A0A3P6TSV8_DIBLA|nr:unnamed protein product [Dibothriocephalus latus]